MKKVLAAALVAMIALTATAQDAYPTKPIRLIINFPAGGTVDVLGRTIAQKLSDKFGQPVVVENRPGAGGNIGAQAVATAPADGYTLLATPPGPLTINQNLYKNMGFDPTKLTSVAMLASVPNAVTARHDLPVNSLKELVAYVQARPGKVTYGSQGNGSTSHLTAEMFSTLIGTEMVHVPFKGEGPALNELLAGRIDLFFGNVSAVMKYREGKQVKVLGLASPKRGSMAPDVPSSSESGLPEFIASAWFAISAPPGTPAPIVAKLNDAINEAMKLPDVREKFAAQGAEVVGGTPAEMNIHLAAERARWKKVIETAHVTID